MGEHRAHDPEGIIGPRPRPVLWQGGELEDVLSSLKGGGELDASIGPGGDADHGASIDRRRQDGATVVIEVRAHEIDPAWSEEDPRRPYFGMAHPELCNHLGHQLFREPGQCAHTCVSHESTIPRGDLIAKGLLLLPPLVGASYGFGMLRRLATSLFLPAVLCLFSACSSVTFERTSQSAGTFVSTGVAFTFFSIDIPKSAINIARENASDANLSNMEVSEAVVTPHLGWFDWMLDIIGIRRARIEGTWGFQDA